MRESKKRLCSDDLADTILRPYLMLVGYLDPLAKEIGLTYQQACILAFLKKRSAITITEFRKICDPIIVRIADLINNLINKKLVLCEYDSGGRRVVLVRISEKGKIKSDTYEKMLDNIFQKISRGLSAEEKKALYLKLSEKVWRNGDVGS